MPAHRVAWRAPLCVHADKACLDQTAIDASLACLPVFLAGCQQLVTIIGPTYTSRLWCVMELFTWFRMGGSQTRIYACAIGAPSEGADALQQSHQEEARAAAVRMLEDFDASQAQCFKVEDRERLLGIIETSFGDLRAFSLLVRGTFCDLLSMRTPEEALDSRRRQVTAAGSSPASVGSRVWSVLSGGLWRGSSSVELLSVEQRRSAERNSRRGPNQAPANNV